MSDAIKKCQNAVMVLGFTHPHFMLIHSKISGKYVESKTGGGIGTMGITRSGKIILNPDFVNSLDKKELAGVLAHEMLHLVLSHADRRGGRDPWTWNVANDMCINKALIDDGIELPKSALRVPNEYQGDLFSETLFDWLVKNPQHIPPKPQNEPQPGAGDGVIDDDDQAPDWRQTAIEARAMAQQAGKGTGGVATLLAPRVPKIDWKKVIRTGFQRACSRPGRDYQTFARKNRRSPVEGPQFPGWQGAGPRICVCIDVSGSMDRKWIERIVTETKNLLKQFPGTRCYLNAHTSDVVFADWVTDSSDGKVDAAVQFSGGTNPNPAYADIQANGARFDSMVHFTDCEFFQEKWPDLPKNVRPNGFIVGGFCREPHTKPPPGSTYFACDIGRDSDDDAI